VVARHHPSSEAWRFSEGKSPGGAPSAPQQRGNSGESLPGKPRFDVIKQRRRAFLTRQLQSPVGAKAPPRLVELQSPVGVKTPPPTPRISVNQWKPRHPRVRSLKVPWEPRHPRDSPNSKSSGCQDTPADSSNPSEPVEAKASPC
jgi:hypothetical protein